MLPRPSLARLWRGLRFVLLASLPLVFGCARGPMLIAPDARQTIDRKLVEYPSGCGLKLAGRGFTAPCAIAFVTDEGEYKGATLVAEAGVDDASPRVYGFRADGSFFNIYPRGHHIAPLDFLPNRDRIYGPIGGMVVAQGRIYVTHRDRNGRGMVSSFGFDGSRMTIVGDLPAQGDCSVTDIAVHPTTGRVWFGLGAATNSGVVGLDNFVVGWVKKYPKFCDLPPISIKLFGYRFDSKNPNAGLMGDDIAVTAPFQPFGSRNQLRINAAPGGKPTAAIYSVAPEGGDLQVEAHGIRLPRGLGFIPDFATPFATNNGMELRGARPVKDDPDSLIKIIQGTSYGWPDFSADLVPVYDDRFKPPPEILVRTTYSELAFLIDHAQSGLASPVPYRDTLLYGVFPSQSGAAKFDFVPSGGAFREYRGSAIIALAGDRAPFATGGQPLKSVVGRKVVRVDLDAKRVEDFIENASSMPASAMKARGDALERPIDVKFAPDGRLYILDYGQMEIREGKERIKRGTGKLFVLEPLAQTASTSAAN